LLVPILGNIIVGVWDLTHRRDELAEPAPEDLEPAFVLRTVFGENITDVCHEKWDDASKDGKLARTVCSDKIFQGDAEFKAYKTVLSQLLSSYNKGFYTRAGHYALGLIKQATGCSYEIPDEKSMRGSTDTISQVLAQCFGEESFVCKNPANLVQLLLLSQEDGPRRARLYELLKLDFNTIRAFSIQSLKDIPMDDWPEKARVIRDFLELIPRDDVLDVTRTLFSSHDEETKKIGEHLLGAVRSQSYAEAIPHLNALAEVLPRFNYRYTERIFSHPFIQCYDHPHREEDPSFVRRLNSHLERRYNHGRRNFFCVHNSLIIRLLEKLIAFCFDV